MALAISALWSPKRCCSSATGRAAVLIFNWSLAPIFTDKRAKALTERGLDFARAAEVFLSACITIPDERQDYGELRLNTVGFLDGRMVVLAWTPRGAARRVISMRKANDREQKRFGALD